MAKESIPQYFITPRFHTEKIQEAMDVFLHDTWLPEHGIVGEKILYHYTTMSGLQGIIRERALWCSHTSTLNDPVELNYGKELITNILQDRMKKDNREELRGFFHSLMVQVQAFGEKTFHVFVSCFCESESLLSQWRSYSDKGGGYNLGLRLSCKSCITSDLKEIGEAKTPFMRKVIYGRKRQEEIVSAYLDLVVDAARKVFGSGEYSQYPDYPDYHSSVMGMQASNVLLDMLPSFKHPAFASENEWRLIRATQSSYQPDKLCFREIPNGLVSYRATHIFELDHENKPVFPLHSIGIGPMLDRMRTAPNIELLLQKMSTEVHPIALKPNEVRIQWAGFSLK